METSKTIGGFIPPLKVGDRFRSVENHERYGYQVVESVEARGVVAAHHLPDGKRGGHVHLYEFDWPGVRSGGINRLS